MRRLLVWAAASPGRLYVTLGSVAVVLCAGAIVVAALRVGDMMADVEALTARREAQGGAFAQPAPVELSPPAEVTADDAAGEPAVVADAVVSAWAAGEPLPAGSALPALHETLEAEPAPASMVVSGEAVVTEDGITRATVQVPTTVGPVTATVVDIGGSWLVESLELA